MYDSLRRLIRVMQPEQEPNANLALADSIDEKVNTSTWGATEKAFEFRALFVS